MLQRNSIQSAPANPCGAVLYAREEVQAMRLGCNDPIASLHRPAPRGKLKRFFFAEPRTYDLANERLETLRQFAVAISKSQHRIVDTLEPILADLGYDTGCLRVQIGALAS